MMDATITIIAEVQRVYQQKLGDIVLKYTEYLYDECVLLYNRTIVAKPSDPGCGCSV